MSSPCECPRCSSSNETYSHVQRPKIFREKGHRFIEFNNAGIQESTKEESCDCDLGPKPCPSLKLKTCLRKKKSCLSVISVCSLVPSKPCRKSDKLLKSSPYSAIEITQSSTKTQSQKDVNINFQLNVPRTRKNNSMCRKDTSECKCENEKERKDKRASKHKADAQPMIVYVKEVQKISKNETILDKIKKLMCRNKEEGTADQGAFIDICTFPPISQDNKTKNLNKYHNYEERKQTQFPVCQFPGDMIYCTNAKNKKQRKLEPFTTNCFCSKKNALFLETEQNMKSLPSCECKVQSKKCLDYHPNFRKKARKICIRDSPENIICACSKIAQKHGNKRENKSKVSKESNQSKLRDGNNRHSSEHTSDSSADYEKNKIIAEKHGGRKIDKHRGKKKVPAKEVPTKHSMENTISNSREKHKIKKVSHKDMLNTTREKPMKTSDHRRSFHPTDFHEKKSDNLKQMGDSHSKLNKNENELSQIYNSEENETPSELIRVEEIRYSSVHYYLPCASRFGFDIAFRKENTHWQIRRGGKHQPSTKNDQTVIVRIILNVLSLIYITCDSNTYYLI